MSAMQRSLKQKVAAVAAVAVLLAGGAVAAVSATGQSSGHNSGRAAARKSDLATAAGYLGIPALQLSSELQSGKTLAQVAGATSGKSPEGLLNVLVAAKRAKLAGATATVTQRVTAEINRVGGPGSLARTPGLFVTAASYLGTDARQLRARLRGGPTLAQIADATPGKSQAGLIDALAQPRKARLAARVAGGKLTQAQENKRLASLETRLTRISQRNFAKPAGQ
jgi:hypothetical protein